MTVPYAFLFFFTLSFASALAAPSQFIAKIYSEALGRAPQSKEWQRWTDHFAKSQCQRTDLEAVLAEIFSAPEYTEKNYETNEMLLTLYRTILSREPEKEGFSFHLARKSKLADAVRDFARSPEFKGLAKSICEDAAYRSDWARSQAIDIGGGVWSQTQVSACLQKNKICTLPPRTVVFLKSTLKIPAGHTLMTAGNPNRRRYARQARRVRDAVFGHLVEVGVGAQLKNVWLSGQRQLFGSRDEVPVDGVRANFFTKAMAMERPSSVRELSFRCNARTLKFMAKARC